MLTSSDKELKQLKASHLNDVSEYHKMVLALQRFKEENAVKALTGKKNIRHQKSPDKVFFTVLEKMLLEVSCFTESLSFHKAEQQLLSLKKVFLWFQSNKHVLMKSDGYFKAARKITEDIHEKQLKSQSKRRHVERLKSSTIKPSLLKTIDFHLEKLRLAEQDAVKKQTKSNSSMFSQSLTQDLTSMGSVTFSDRDDYEEDLDFAREIYDHEYFGGNKIEHLNRPMTAPLKLKPPDPPSRSHAPTQVSLQRMLSQNNSAARPQSALTQVKHDLSWAKTSPLPLTVLIQKNAEDISKNSVPDNKKTLRLEIPSETQSLPEKPRFSSLPNKADDGKKMENLFLFKQFCLEHATQQENYSRQYTHHKHGTRQHFLEFPENRTESVVRQTATNLYKNQHQSSINPGKVEKKLGAYQGMSLEQFLDHDVTQKSRDFADQSVNGGVQVESASKLPHPPFNKPERVVQPSRDLVMMSALCELAPGTGKRMNIASEQALSAPKHGWRYPVVPIPTPSHTDPSRSTASGVVLALQEDDSVQHKVLIPLAPNLEASSVQDQGVQTNFMNEDDISHDDLRPKSRLTTVPGQTISASPSRASSRPWSSPRYVTQVNAILRNRATGSRSCFDIRPDLERGEHEVKRRSLRSAGVSGGSSRPKTSVSWGTYPSKAEVSRSSGAASHHSTGVLRHRSVAETMRVKSVSKQSMRTNSGRSSASSYVAQLRERKRAGAKLCAQVKPGPRKSSDYEQTMYEVTDRKPYLSFIQIASPMSMPTAAENRTYARPGGVYCGSTAAVVVASEGQVNIMDDESSEGQLSFEEYFANTLAEGSATNGENNNGDDWLSQWLTGGPLDGLNDSAGNGRATTYADLVSRAAIIDSSDERSYSEDVQSNFPADVAGISPRETLSLSPKDNLSLSPRTDQLVSHRTETDDEEERDHDETNQSDDYANEEYIQPAVSESSLISSDSLLSSDAIIDYDDDGDTDELTEEDDETITMGNVNSDRDAIDDFSSENNLGDSSLIYDENNLRNLSEKVDTVTSSYSSKTVSSSRKQVNGELSTLSEEEEENFHQISPKEHLAVIEEIDKSDADDDQEESARNCSSSTYDTMTESETEIVGDDTGVRIVVTSARKVERELQEAYSYNPKNNPFKTNPVSNRAHSRLITRQEVSAVASMSRPHSSRPIPCETDVRDPFVDFVASTRQKQIDRSVDVQTIFKADTADDKEVVDEKTLRQKQEAAVKMQRAYRRHLARVRAARKCQGLSQESLEWARSYKAMLMEKREMRKRRLRDARESSRTMQRREAKKMSEIGPHHDVFKIYHPKPVFPHPEVIQDSAVEIQKLVRGWLVRRRLKNVKDAAKKRGNSISAVVSEYRSLLERTQRRHGKLKPSLYLTYDELNEYLQQRAKFELVFKKREFWNEMEASDLPNFFNDCGLFPSQEEIKEAWDSVSKTVDFSRKKKKHSATAMSVEDVIEVAFYIYVPAGARMKPETTRSSTWMTPIYKGEEGLKLIGASNEERSEVESADFQLVTKLVAQTFKERNKANDT